ncbi:hypothetical protein GW17_00002333 [Ensete ventricosum]|nr:hypothetical protein GW17_00002333 [Ensete ventricosum]
MNKLLMEENDRLQKQVSQLVYENGYMRHQLHNVSLQVAEILKDRPSWYRDCRSLDVLTVIPAGNGGNIELIYMQVCSYLDSTLCLKFEMVVDLFPPFTKLTFPSYLLHQTYAPTTLAVARDFWTLRYSTALEDGSLVICERSLTPATGGPAGPPAPNFVRAEMLPSGYLIRPCEGGGSMIHIVDHVDLDVNCGVDAYSAASLRANPYAVPGVRASTGFLGSLSSRSCIMSLSINSDSPAATRTLDLASMLEIGSGATARSVNETASSTYNLRSVLTIAFQFTYENHLRDNVAAIARQYVRSVVTSVQRVAMAIAPSRPGCQIGVKHPPGSPEAHTLAQWISRSYRFVSPSTYIRFSTISQHRCGEYLADRNGVLSSQASPVFTFSNQAGLDMLETTLIALQDLTLEKILDDNGRKVLCSEFPKIMQQVSKPVKSLHSACFPTRVKPI